MWSFLVKLATAILSLFVKSVARPSGARDAEDAHEQEKINEEIDSLPPLPPRK